MSGDIRVLSVGLDMDIATKSFDWDQKYNIKDFHWVFLDYYSLDQRVSDGNISDVLEGKFRSPDRHKMFQAVATGTSIIVLLPMRRTISHGNGTRAVLDRYFPNDLEFVEETGESIDFETILPSWSWYFKNSFAWNLLLKGVPDVFEYEGEKYGYEYKSIAENVSNEMLACTVLFHKIIKNTSEYEMAAKSQPQTSELPGQISFLPVIGDWEPEELAKEVLDEFTDIDTKIKTDDSPDWVDDWALPSEEETTTQLKKFHEKKSQIELKIDEKMEELQEYEEYKVLLWGNEDLLEQKVPTVFRELGFEVEGEEPHGRDGMIYLNGKRVVLEITGTTGGISDYKCRQLDSWVTDLELEPDDHEYTGLLVVNPDRKTRPSDRKRNEFLPPHLQEFLEKRNHSVLLTPDLYDILSKYREGKVVKDEIRKKLEDNDLFLNLS